MQSSIIPSLPPVSPRLGQPIMSLTQSGQPVTDALLSQCWIKQLPGPILQYKKQTVSYRTGIQEKRPPGSFEVAMDALT